MVRKTDDIRDRLPIQSTRPLRKSQIQSPSHIERSITMHQKSKRPELFYDMVIVGAGPAGLALAQCCSSIGKRVLLIDREYDVGGCHRVRRYRDFFTEHGPRIYSTTYKVFITLLRDMGLDFYDLFTPYNFTISDIGNQTVWKTLSYSELFTLAIEFIKLLFNNDYGIDITMATFMKVNSFGSKSFELIDRICRLTDGADASKYTLNEFLQLFNQQYFHKIYQPKYPNDNGLFKLWKRHLYNSDVDMLLGYNVDRIIRDPYSGTISDIVITQRDHATNTVSESILVSGGNFVMAVPPLHLIDILSNSDKSVQNCWGDFDLLRKWAFHTAYIEYVSLTFHWDYPLDLPKIYGFPKTSWGLAYIVLSDYMDFDSIDSRTVISLAITITDKPNANGKTADQSNYQELVNETFAQLRQSFPQIPKPSRILLSPGVYHDGARWISRDTAFITSANADYLPFTGSISNLFSVGTHNGKHIYRFTSMESAVTNAVAMAHYLYPELQSKYPITSGITVRYVLVVSIVLLAIVAAIYTL